jgi:DNA-directed RNA polymerase specialized sigma54-like protein
MAKQNDWEKDQESTIPEVRKFPDPAEIEAVIDQLPGSEHARPIDVTETLKHMSSKVRQEIEESIHSSGMVSQHSMEQNPTPQDPYLERHLLRKPEVTAEDIARAVVDELEHRGYLPFNRKG